MVPPYQADLVRMIAGMGLGTGALAVIGGTVGIVGFLTMTTGALVPVPATTMSNIGVEAFTGFFGALQRAYRRPVDAGVALAATVGAGATAELGAMRISEEIDALEVMGIRSIAFLATTRVMAGLVVIIPIYAMAMIMCFLSPQDHHDSALRAVQRHLRALLRTFLRPDDVFWSFWRRSSSRDGS